MPAELTRPAISDSDNRHRDSSKRWVQGNSLQRPEYMHYVVDSCYRALKLGKVLETDRLSSNIQGLFFLHNGQGAPTQRFRCYLSDGDLQGLLIMLTMEAF